ncbi:hypothetical protein IW262DRAFT_1464921 [Armillaria fumosa]|nr:hypothetical protein IW262DRAFT_1464921 [Armillaria fumosa]
MLYDLPDDVLIYIVAFLSVPDILHLRQTCKLFNALSRLGIVWTHAFKHNILSNDYPCNLDESDLEQRTCDAYRLATQWLGDRPLASKSDTIFTGSSVHEIKFIPGRQHQWLLTICKESTDRYVVAVWNIPRMEKRSEWCQEGRMLRGVTCNTDPESEANIVVASQERLVFLHLDDNGILHEMKIIDMILYSVAAFHGDIIALDDTTPLTVIYSWKTGARAFLGCGDDLRRNHCLKVVFTSSIIIVVRSFSISIYTAPLLLHGQTHVPIFTHPFDWVNGVSVALTNPLSILICSDEYDDHVELPRSPELCSLASFFTPILTGKKVSNSTGFVLGKRATAVCARNLENSRDNFDPKTLLAAVFPGPLNPTDQARVREVCTLRKPWYTFDYDEDLGRIAYQSDVEQITILQL